MTLRTTAAATTAAWDRYWFATSTKYHYGLFRIIFVTGFFLVPVTGLRFANVPSLADDAIDRAFLEPTVLLRILPLPVPACRAGCSRSCSSAGLHGGGRRCLPSEPRHARGVEPVPRPTLNSYGFIAHDTTLPTIFLLVLAFAPGVSACSLDAVIARVPWPCRDWIRLGVRLPVWPVRLLLVVMALIDFVAGYAGSGDRAEWATASRTSPAATTAATTLSTVLSSRHSAFRKVTPVTVFIRPDGKIDTVRIGQLSRKTELRERIKHAAG